MKQLSIEEKAKAYDDAIVVINKSKTDKYGCIIGIKPSDIFPELKESEDERIRKWIIHDIQQALDDSIYNGESIDSAKEALAWLKKQGEHANFLSKIQIGDKVTRNDNGELVNLSQLQRVAKPCKDEPNPADKVEPKFKVGDWIIHNKNTELSNSLMLVTDKVSDGYLCKYRDGQCSYNIEFIDKEYHLWTIQDAKDGDVLACAEYRFPNIIIYGGYINNYGDRIGNKAILAYCGWNGEKLVINKKKKEGFGGIGYVPATKEQRALLFQKMKEAGYEWDSEKKELKKIEHNPAWSEEDEHNLLELVMELEYRSGLYQLNHKDYSQMIKWLKDLKDRYAWKPSEEQMEALDDFIYAKYPNIEKHGVAIKSLYQDLKKLMEE